MREWVALLLAVVATFLSLVAFVEGRRIEAKNRDIEATRLLDQAWDLLGGKPGTYAVVSSSALYFRTNSTRFEQELARRLIWEALQKAPQLPLAHLRQGGYWVSQGRLEEAEESYRQALLLNPASSKAHLGLANVLALKEGYDQIVMNGWLNLSSQTAKSLEDAEWNLRRAIEIEPELASSHHNLGLLLLNLGRFQEAEKSVRRALELDPTFHETHTILGISLINQGEMDKAEERLQQALLIEPDSVSALTNLANILASQGRFGEAEELAQRAVQSDSDSFGTYAVLAYVFLLQGRSSEAESEIKHALALNSECAVCYNTMAYAYLFQGRLEESETNIRRALEIEPTSAIFHDSLGDILHSKGDKNGAVASYRKALEFDPKHPETSNKLDQLLANQSTHGKSNLP